MSAPIRLHMLYMALLHYKPEQSARLQEVFTRMAENPTLHPMIKEFLIQELQDAEWVNTVFRELESLQAATDRTLPGADMRLMSLIQPNPMSQEQQPQQQPIRPEGITPLPQVVRLNPPRYCTCARCTHFNRLHKNVCNLTGKMINTTMNNIPHVIDWTRQTKSKPETPDRDDEAEQQPAKRQKKELPSFLCPISQEVMNDPVIAFDGHCYERYHITKWFYKKGPISPLTNTPLPTTTVIRNHTLRKAIEEYYADST